MLAGTYFPTTPTNMKQGDSIVGQYGATIDGTNVVQGFDVTSTAIIRGWNCFSSSPCAGVTVSNLYLRNMALYDCVGIYEDGSTVPGAGWTITYTDVSACGAQGINTWSNGTFSHNRAHDSGCGIGGYRNSHTMVDHNEIDHNRNSGCKWGTGDNLTISDNWVHDNAFSGPALNTGLWLDTVGPGDLIDGNLVTGQAIGIMYEATDQGRVTGNTVAGNTDKGIYVSNAWSVEVDHNIVSQTAGMALQLFEDTLTGYTVHDVYFHDNSVDLSAHTNSPAVGLSCSNTSTCAADYGASQRNRFDFNAYATGGHATWNLWLWGAGGLTWTGWQAIQEDPNGSIT